MRVRQKPEIFQEEIKLKASPREWQRSVDFNLGLATDNLRNFPMPELSYFHLPTP